MHVCYIYFESLLLNAYKLKMSSLHSELNLLTWCSWSSVPYNAFLVSFVWYHDSYLSCILFKINILISHLFAFKLTISLCFRWVSYKQQMPRCSFIRSDDLYFLIGIFSPLIFIVISDVFGLLSSFYSSCFFLCLFCLFPCHLFFFFPFVPPY